MSVPQDPLNLSTELIAAKQALRDDQTDANRARRDTAVRAIQDWRQSPAGGRGQHRVFTAEPGVYFGADAEAFLPESEGGDDARALLLTKRALEDRGDDTTDPAEELARTRENA